MAQAQKASAPNFASVLDRPASSVERPPAYPVGQYVAVIKGLPRRDKSSKKQTEYVEFTYKYLSAYNDTVDEEAISALGGIPAFSEGKLTFYMTEKSGYRLREFLENDLGLEQEGDEDTLWEMAQRANGNQFIVTLIHEPAEDGKGIYAKAKDTAPVE